MVVDYEGQQVFRHQGLPDVVPDFIYLDGPAVRGDVKIAVDIVDMEAKLPDDVLIVIDGRYRNRHFLQKHLRQQYHCKVRTLFKNSYLRPVR